MHLNFFSHAQPKLSTEAPEIANFYFQNHFAVVYFLKMTLMVMWHSERLSGDQSKCPCYPQYLVHRGILSHISIIEYSILGCLGQSGFSVFRHFLFPIFLSVVWLSWNFECLIKQMLKISAFYLEKKSFIPKNIWSKP